MWRQRLLHLRRRGNVWAIDQIHLNEISAQCSGNGIHFKDRIMSQQLPLEKAEFIDSQGFSDCDMRLILFRSL